MCMLLTFALVLLILWVVTKPNFDRYVIKTAGLMYNRYIVFYTNPLTKQRKYFHVDFPRKDPS